jgi:DNA invertase Pin-like site-specific DNA recombinase
MKVGYARVSTAEQCLDGQSDRLIAAGCEKIFTDTASGSRSDRPQFLAMMEFAREGDVLVVLKFDRIGRSLKHLLETVTKLDERGVKIESLTEGLDTSTPGGKLVMSIFGAIAQFERDLIIERTQIGLSAARSRGKVGGRPSRLSAEQVATVRSMSQNRDIPVDTICTTFKISRSTYYRCLESVDLPAAQTPPTATADR